MLLENLLKYQYIEQNFDEIEWLTEKVAQLHPTAILEIGMKHGGTLIVWDSLLEQNKTNLIIGIDYNLEVSWNVNSSKNTIYVVSGSSHDVKVQNAVKALLGEKQLDFLFLDSEHTDAAVKNDFEAYGKLVRPGGLIGFHDVGDIKGFLSSLDETKIETMCGKPPFKEIGLQAVIGVAVYHVDK